MPSGKPPRHRSASWGSRSLLAVFALGLAAAARGGPPFVTDDPEPVDAGAWEVNYALTGSRASGGTFAYLPQVDANFGPMPGVQIHVQPQVAFESGGGTQAYGLGDTELGLKLRLTPASEEEGRWMISLYPLFEVPTGSASRKLGAGATSAYLPVWFQTKRGNWLTYGGGGYWIDNATGSRNTWAGGWVALYQFTEALQFGGEAFAKGAQTPGGRASSGFNLGGAYALAKDYNLLFSAGRGMTNSEATNQASLYLGLQVAY